MKRPAKKAQEAGAAKPELEVLLRRAWSRLAECVCHGGPGSEGHREMLALMDAIDEALPGPRREESS